MKLNQKQYTSVTSFAGEEGKGSISSKKFGLILNLLIKNYNHPELAVLREWVSNAHDSHVVAGQDRPIEVTLPTALNKMLVVEDFGIGMTHEEFTNTYMVVLESMKDMSNIGIGGFGIGSKSGLAISDQYTIRCVKNGLENFYIVKRDDDGGISYQRPIADRPTDLPTGVKTQVNVEESGVYTQDNLDMVLGGWSTNDVEIKNGKFNSIVDNAIRVPSGYIFNSIFDPSAENNDNLYVMVGPVLYSIKMTNSLMDDLNKSIPISNYRSFTYYGGYMGIERHFVPVLEIGSVSFPSSREVIEMNKENVKTIAEAYKRSFNDFKDELKRRMKNLKNEKEAILFSESEAMNYLSESDREDFSFNGEVIPTDFETNIVFSIQDDGKNGFQVQTYREPHKTYSGDILPKQNFVRNSFGSNGRESFLNSYSFIVDDTDADEDMSKNKIRALIRHYHKIQEFKNSTICVVDSMDNWKEAVASETFTISELREFRKNNPIEKKKSKEDTKNRLLSNVKVSGVCVRDKAYQYIGNYGYSVSLQDVIDKGYDKIYVYETEDKNDYRMKSRSSELALILNKIKETEGDDHENVVLCGIASRHKMETVEKLIEVGNISDYLESKRKVLEDSVSVNNVDMNSIFGKTPVIKVHEILRSFAGDFEDKISGNLLELKKFLEAHDLRTNVDALSANYSITEVNDFVKSLNISEKVSDELQIPEKIYFGLLIGINGFSSYRIRNYYSEEEAKAAIDSIYDYLSSEADKFYPEVVQKIIDFKKNV